MLQKAQRQERKAVAQKVGAIETFSTALDKVEKANDLLEQAIEEDTTRKQLVMAKIQELDNELGEIMDAQDNRRRQIADNNALAARLREFT